jgi:transposase
MPRKTAVSEDKIKILEKYITKKQGSAKELARCQAILMHANRIDFKTIALITGIKKSALFQWRSRFIKSGIDELKDKNKPASKALLTKAQIAETLHILKTKTPQAFEYQADFWTAAILAHMLKEKYNVEPKTKKPLYLLFKQAKFSFHKPGQQYRNRNQQEIDEWVEKNKPIIEGYLKDPNIIVLTGDEMVLSTQTTFQKIWLPINQYPKIDVSNNRKNRSVYGFLNIKDGTQHAFKTEWQNSTITCEVLEKVCKAYPGLNIVLLWDNASWHRSQEVREWLKNTKHNIYLMALPRYAPELNPQEHVWKEGRSKTTHNKFIENIDTATDELVDYLNNTKFNYKLLGLVQV